MTRTVCTVYIRTRTYTCKHTDKYTCNVRTSTYVCMYACAYSFTSTHENQSHTYARTYPTTLQHSVKQVVLGYITNIKVTRQPHASHMTITWQVCCSHGVLVFACVMIRRCKSSNSSMRCLKSLSS